MSQGFFAQFRGTAPPPNLSSSFTSDTTATADMSSSRKRTRDARDIDGDVEVESASSSFRHNIPKRSKVALAAENGGSVVSDDEDEIDGFASQSRIYGNDIDRDDDDDTTASLSDMDDDDDELDELRAARIVEKQMREHRDNIASEQGVIEEVFCSTLR